MPRFAGVPVDPMPQPVTTAGPRFAGVPVEESPKITDLEPVHARLSPQDDPDFSFPDTPGNGADLLAWARWKRPALAQVPDQELVTRIRREVYPDMDPVAFYRDTGFDKLVGVDTATLDPTAGMSGVEKFRAGAGKSLADTPRGVRQLAVDALDRGNAMAYDALDAVGLDGVAANFARHIAAPVNEYAHTLRDEATAQRAADAPLMRTGAGLAGNITGNIVQTIGPGVALHGTVAGRALLPTTVRGNAAAGAVVGAAQPVAEDESRLVNAGAGTLGGAVGAGAPKLVGAAIRGARRLSPAATRSAQERAAAEALEGFAHDPAAVRQALTTPQTIVAGSLPSTAEATGDIGLGNLQRTLANQPEFGAAMTLRNEANNRARVAAIETAFGGANAAQAEALTAARDLAARQALRPIERVAIQDLAPVVQGVTRLSVKHQASRPVREALAAVDAELPRIKTVADAHAVRRFIGDMLAGKVEGLDGKLAASQLITVRDLLDRQMRQAFPAWGTFLRDYKAASREIGQVNVGEALLDKGPNLRAVGDVPQLSPDKFAGAADNLDRTVAQATGFKRATAAKALTPQQIKVVDEVRRDLERFAQTQRRGQALGSPTMQNAIGGNRVQDAVGPVGAAMIEPASGAAMLALNAMRKHYGGKVAGIVEEAMLNPERAAEILATLPPASRRMIVRQFAELMNQSAGAAGRATAPALAQ
jgi:hypothetical protein